ncbi:MAG TPA: DinB family protein [Candidatus Limnocylindrales bacterium]|nr:DinB family protein [Candidatus Limnocylindrales bacterium]
MTITQAVEALIRKTVDLTDEDLGREWKWGAYDEEGLRFALLMTHHELRDLAVRLAAERGVRTHTAGILAQYHQAYRDLTGALAPTRTEDLDRAPAEGEWPVREVCTHMLGAEYGFLRVCRIALERHRAGKPDEPPEAEWDAASVPFIEQRKAATEPLATADVRAIRDAFAAIHIRNLRELADITDVEVDLPSWFWDGAMPIRFRLHRFEAHLRQHTIQLDKTLVAIGRGPTEAHRLIRNIYNALADVEMEPGGDGAQRAATEKTIAERAEALR